MTSFVAAIVVALVVAPGLPALANHASATSVTITYSGGSFSGKVSSPEPGCVPDRTVRVRRTSDNSLIGETTTGADGNWQVPAPGVTGTFRAEVPGAIFATYDPAENIHECQPGTSNDIVVSPAPGHQPPPATPTVTAIPTPTETAIPTPTETASPTPTETPVVDADSTISLGHDGAGFFGRVGSEDDGCVEARRVRIFKIKQDGDVLIGRARTDADGMYFRERPRAKGSFFARVRGELRGASRCLAASSPTVEIRRVPMPRVCRQEDAIVGTPGPDVLVATDRAAVICGLGGDDVLDGRGGPDLLLGGGGDDDLRGGRGHDDLRGGRGHDVLRGGRGHDVVRSGAGNDVVRGGASDDVLRGGEGDDQLYGGRGDDVLIGGRGENFQHGGPGTDRCLPGGLGTVSIACERFGTRTSTLPPSDRPPRLGAPPAAA